LLRIGFSPRRANLVIYFMGGGQGSAGSLAKLGKYKVGKSCLHLNKLDDVDLAVLRRARTALVGRNAEEIPHVWSRCGAFPGGGSTRPDE
jgi:hypothetical protein